MIVFRVVVQVHQARIGQARALFGTLTQASRVVPGVVCFDILQDPDDAGTVRLDRGLPGLGRGGPAGVLPELATVTAAFDDLLTDGPQGTIFHVGSAEPWPAR